MNERILIVEDEEMLARSMARFLTRRGFIVETASDGHAAMERLRHASFDAIATDIRMPRCDGLQLLARMKKEGCAEPVVIMSAHGTFETAVDAMKLGVQDFLRKPVDLNELEAALRRSISLSRIRRELTYLRKCQAGSEAFPAPVGRAKSSRAIQEELHRVAAAARGLEAGDSPPLLLTGETGTGKSLLARYFHRLVAEKEVPFIEVNCTSLPASLIESELFGHERGAFTDAKTARKGLVEAAEGGTLYLDEIGHLDPSMQGKLLTTIEEKMVRRVGGTETRRVDFRIVASTNKCLETAMAEQAFRSDLFFRLTTFRVHVPPLRERLEDVEVLAAHFLQRLAAKYCGPPCALAPESLGLLLDYDWPGNVRELRNVMERAIVLSGQQTILPVHLPGVCRKEAERTAPAGGFRRAHIVLPQEGLQWDEVESQLLEQALVRSGGNTAAAARLLGLSRSRFRYRLKRSRGR